MSKIILLIVFVAVWVAVDFLLGRLNVKARQWHMASGAILGMLLFACLHYIDA